MILERKGAFAQNYFLFVNNIFINYRIVFDKRWGGRIAEAVACRAALYGFNSHPQLFCINPQLLGDKVFSHFICAS